MEYPTIAEVESADHEQICRWARFLEVTANRKEQEVVIKICDRFDEFGGITPEISKKIGWNESN